MTEAAAVGTSHECGNCFKLGIPSGNSHKKTYQKFLSNREDRKWLGYS